MGIQGLDDRLARERRARLQAERLLALRSEELYSANRKLAEHAHALSHQVIEQRQENAALKGLRSQATQALEVATDRAQLAERRLWDSVAAVEDGFAVYDPDCRLVAANPAFVGAFDGVVDVAPGASYEAILRIAAEEGLVDLEGELTEDWIDRMLARWDASQIPQVDVKLWNGAYLRLIDKRTPQGDTVCLAVNITETVRNASALRDARDAALAANRAKSAFLANMSHEIRTPMNGVVAMADMLRETELSDDQTLYADTIRNSGEALLVIINDILDYSKIEADKLVLRPEAFDLPAMIEDILHLLRPSVAAKKLDLRMDYDLFLPDRVIGDQGRIRQVMTNLIGNAVNFTESGHVLVRVIGDPPPAAGDDKVVLRVVVEDTGVGIAPEMQAHVFGEFNQVEEQQNRRFDGTGLGLAISRRLIDLMGGEMWLASTLGEGSAFGFRVALDADPEAPACPTGPLPADLGDVVLVGKIGPRAQPLIGTLGRLHVTPKFRARVPKDLSAVAAVIYLGTPPKRVRVPRRSGVLLACFGSKAAPGMVPIPPDISPAELSDLLRNGADAVPQAAAQGGSCKVEEVPPPAAAGTVYVLAAEDNKTNQLVFRTMLKGQDIDLTLVEDGEAWVAAYDAALAGEVAMPDVIFTDISMPRMDGSEAAQKIRDAEAAAGVAPVPIIAMTAHGLTGDRERILANGIDDYLTKPLKKKALLDLLEARARPGSR